MKTFAAANPRWHSRTLIDGAAEALTSSSKVLPE